MDAMTQDQIEMQAAREALATLPYAGLVILECPVCGDLTYGPCSRCLVARPLAPIMLGVALLAVLAG